MKNMEKIEYEALLMKYLVAWNQRGSFKEDEVKSTMLQWNIPEGGDYILSQKFYSWF